MKILLVADPMIPVPPLHYGGIERIIDMLCRAYTSLGHQVRLIAHPESNTAAELVPLPGLKHNSYADLLRNALRITRQTIDLRPDVVHSFGRLIQLTPLFPFRLPKIMSYQREPSLSVIARAHRLARNDSLMFTGCSDYISAQIRSVARGVTVHNGVPLRSFEFRSQVDDDAPLVFLGRVESIKGAHNAIDIAARSGRRLIIAGNTPDGDEHQLYFHSQIKPRLNDRIQYIGPVNDEQKNRLLGKALALVMAIEWNEPFGIVMAEALACGTPVIGTRRGAVPEVVEDGITGFVRENITELIECVDFLPQIDRHFCRTSCEKRFSDTHIAAQYLQIYDILIDKNRHIVSRSEREQRLSGSPRARSPN